MPIQSSKTLTARRSLNPLDSIKPQEENKGGDSIFKFFMWIIVVFLVAVLIYFLINTIVEKQSSNKDNKGGQQTSEEPKQKTFEAKKIDSTGVSVIPKSADYRKIDQTLGETTTSDFTIKSLETESYDKFFRFQFEVTSSSGDAAPLVSAEYDSSQNAINLVFQNVINDNSGLTKNQSIIVSGSVVDSIERLSSDNETTAKYSISLSENMGYYLHSGENASLVIIDVEENVEPSVSLSITPTPEETETVKPTSKSLTNEFSMSDQYIVSEVTGNVVTTQNYKWQDFGPHIQFTYDLLGGIPNVTSTLVDKGGSFDLVVTMVNRVTRNATSSVPINHGNVTTVDVVTSGNSSTMTFHLIKKSNYRIYATESPMKFLVEVKD